MKIRISITLLFIVIAFGPLLAQKKTKLLILPTIHTGHAKNVSYSFDHVSRIIENFKPDIIAIEIRPEDMDQDTVYLKKFYQPEMIMARIAYPGIKKVGIDFMGSEIEGRNLPDNFSRDTIGEMGRFRIMNQRLMKDTLIVKARITNGLVKLKSKQGEMMGKLSANEMLDGRYDQVTDEYTKAQTAVLANTPYQYYDLFSVKRDQKIADNIKDLALKNPGKRIIVLTGANHHNRAVNTLRDVKSVKLISKVKDH